MDVLVAKIISFLTLLVSTLLFGLIPLSFRKTILESTQRNHRASMVLSYLNCFAGGVFMGTALVHLLPEINEQLEGVLPPGNNFPFPEFIAGCGFFLVMIVERVVLLCCPSRPRFQTFVQETAEKAPSVGLSEEHKPKYGTFDSSTSDAICNENSTRDVSPRRNSIEYKDERKQQLMIRNPSSDSNNPARCHSNTVHSIRALVLLLALSLHTVFEGLSLGLQQTTSGVWNLLIAISVHKCIIAFTLGLQLTETQSKLRVIFFMLAFALMSPIGIGVGVGVTNIDLNEYSQNLIGGILQGIATGTFIYVTFFEVLQKELGNDNNLLKVLPAVVGFVAMSCLTLLE